MDLLELSHTQGFDLEILSSILFSIKTKIFVPDELQQSIFGKYFLARNGIIEGIVIHWLRLRGRLEMKSFPQHCLHSLFDLRINQYLLIRLLFNYIFHHRPHAPIAAHRDPLFFNDGLQLREASLPILLFDEVYITYLRPFVRLRFIHISRINIVHWVLVNSFFLHLLYYEVDIFIRPVLVSSLVIEFFIVPFVLYRFIVHIFVSSTPWHFWQPPYVWRIYCF